MLMDEQMRAMREMDRPVPWNHFVIRAIQDATQGNHLAVAHELETARQRARRTGTDDGLPDLLVPIALAAFVDDDHERCAGLLGAVRAASRPTQNFGPTLIYHRLRREVGLPSQGTDLSDTAAIYAEGRDWLIASDAQSASAQ